MPCPPGAVPLSRLRHRPADPDGGLTLRSFLLPRAGRRTCCKRQRKPGLSAASRIGSPSPRCFGILWAYQFRTPPSSPTARSGSARRSDVSSPTMFSPARGVRRARPARSAGHPAPVPGRPGRRPSRCRDAWPACCQSCWPPSRTAARGASSRGRPPHHGRTGRRAWWWRGRCTAWSTAAAIRRCSASSSAS